MSESDEVATAVKAAFMVIYHTVRGTLKHYEGHNDLHYERNVHNDLWGFLMQQHYELPNAAITRSFLMQTLGAS